MRLTRSVMGFLKAYPGQFWFLVIGALVTRISMSMIWPFVTVVIRERLDIALTAAALLITIQSLTSLLSTLVVSSIMDRLGRKLPTIIGLLGTAAAFFAFAAADSFEMWALLMAISGVFQPVFNIAVNTMVAEIVPLEGRSSAYALTRMVGNAGVAIGPVIGGILISLLSFEAVYFTIALTHALLTVFVIFSLSESLPQVAPELAQPVDKRRLGYRFILRDSVFLGMFGMYLLVMLGNTQIFVLLPVYAKEVFGMVEREYGLLLSINAAMVVLCQYPITRLTDRFPPLRVMAWAALLYAIGLGSVLLGYNLPTFSLSMVIVTLGELMLMPTALTLTAAIAPADMRVRYMGLLGLAWPLSAGVGPVIGGALNDLVSPAAMWVGASAMAFVGALGFLGLIRLRARKRDNQTTTMSLP